MSNTLDDGSVMIELDGVVRALQCTPAAVMTISKVYGAGGVQEAINRIFALDFEAFVVVVNAGLGFKPKTAKEADEQVARVYAAGMTDLRVPLLDYLGALARGGKPLPKDDDQGEAKAAA